MVSKALRVTRATQLHVLRRDIRFWKRLTTARPESNSLDVLSEMRIRIALPSNVGTGLMGASEIPHKLD